MKKSSNCGSEAPEHASNNNKNMFSRDHFCLPIVPDIWKGGRCCPRIHNLSDDPIISVNWYCRRSESLISTDDDAASLVASAKAGKALRGNITCMQLGSQRHVFLAISCQTDELTSYGFPNLFPHVPIVTSADCLKCLFPTQVSFSRRVAVGQFLFLWRASGSACATLLPYQSCTRHARPFAARQLQNGNQINHQSDRRACEHCSSQPDS
jgi:hypothetical protein